MKKIPLTILLFMAFIPSIVAQTKSTSNMVMGNQGILDFLNIPADSRSAGMGDVGIATTPDSYAHFFNPAKTVFIDSLSGGINISYTPWLRKLVNDMYITSVSGYYKIDALQSVSGSLRYFALGEMELRDESGERMGTDNPFQLTFDVAYARKLSEYISASVSFRYLLSKIYPNNIGYKAGWSMAADVSLFFNKKIRLFGEPMLGAGFSLSNLGTKVSYRENLSIFMPMNLRLGTSLSYKVGANNRLMISTDIGRSLVPTDDAHLDNTALEGMVNAFSEGAFKSMMWGVGAEFFLMNYIGGRMGYYNENRALGNRKYLTFGVGLKYKSTHFDFAYLVPTGMRQNAMGNTLRISLAVDIK